MAERKYTGKDLTSYGHAIDKAATLEEARALFIEMCEQFDFKDKQAAYIREAKEYNKPKKRFTMWAWNIILSSQGLKVI